MLEGPKVPTESEYLKVLEFLNQSLRNNCNWSIDKEYPTALSLANRHNMNIVLSDDQIVSHAVLKPLIIKSPHAIFKVGAIGSVVTDENFRNQGWSQKILQQCLQQSSEQQCDIAILWTNLYDFYRKLGFELTGYECSFVFENEFDFDNQKYRYSSDSRVSVEAISRIYAQHSVGSVRTHEEFKKFIQIPNTRIFTAWTDQGQLAAYAVEGKGADLSNYIHEWGGSVSAIINLLGYIRKEKKTPITIIVPKHSLNLIDKLKEKTQFYNEGYLGMVKIINFDQLAAKVKKAFRNVGVNDIVFEKNNDLVLFGCGQDICTINDMNQISQLIFGPISFSELGVFQKATVDKLEKILPLPLWVWGWDSV